MDNNDYRSMMKDTSKRVMTNHWKNEEWKDKTCKAAVICMTNKQKDPDFIKKKEEGNRKYIENNPEAQSRRAINQLQDPSSDFGYRKTKSCYYKGIRMRSSWEVEFARLCDEHNIKWDYEPQFFKMKTCRYLPDFYLSELNKYIEVKPNYFHNTVKVDEFKELHGIELVPLDISQFQEYLH